jgi:isoleucyl-tRNA synthetase
VVLDAADLQVRMHGPDAWAAVADRETVVAVDTRITEDLKLEGLAREAVRHIQQLRKDADLQLEDRIELYLSTTSVELQKAIDHFRNYIMAETLTINWSATPLGDGAAKADVKVDGQPLHIELRKV